jgi:hypothetical protein
MIEAPNHTPGKFPVRSVEAREFWVSRDRCPECGGELDTGCECNECGFDAEPIRKRIPTTEKG